MKTRSANTFHKYKTRAKNANNINDLLPGLNDIADAFEALPLDLIKYFTLLKEIDAKCINTVPQINGEIKTYIDRLHEKPIPVNDEDSGVKKTPGSMSTATKMKRLRSIHEKVNEIIPCLEEKMHVTLVATDLMQKHLNRINNDYKLILQNNEIPELIRIGPLNHPAMIMDNSTSGLNGSGSGSGVGGNGDSSVPSQRSESRREALAAKKASREDSLPAGGDEDLTPSGRKKKTQNNGGNGASGGINGSGGTSAKEEKTTKKRSRKDDGPSATEGKSGRSVTPMGSSVSTSGALGAKKRKRKDDDDSVNASSGNNNGNNNNSNINGGNNNEGLNYNHGPPIKEGTSSNEPTYCYCNQVSFGEMVGCDGEDCKREWFHLPCIGFKNPPKGKWYCDDCLAKMKKAKKV